MENFYAPSDIREADGIAVQKYGVPSLLLMENAGCGAAEAAADMAGGFRGKRFLVLAGSGANGGDGFVAARRILTRGGKATVIKTSPDEKYTGDALINLKILRGMTCENLKISEAQNASDAQIASELDEAAVIMDAILGTGANGAPRGEAARLISLAGGRKNILSLDVPSGVDAGSGKIYEPCVEAAVTVTFLAPKFGMAFSPALEKCGRITTQDIGVPKDAVLPVFPALTTYDKSDLKQMLPAVSRDVHKTRRGSLLVYSGSGEYGGTPLLTARGALRAGCGLVYIATPDFIAAHVSTALPEAIVLPLATRGGEIQTQTALDVISKALEKCDAAAAGPGCGRSQSAEELFLWLWNESGKPLLLDADALWFYARRKESLTPREDALITPHAGEAALILNTTAEEINANRASAARALVGASGAALLKGRDTLVASENSLSMIKEGTPALAVPGSGDVLSGVIGAFMAGGLSARDAAICGALAHGAAGRALEGRRGARGVLAREIADEIPSILGR